MRTSRKASMPPKITLIRSEFGPIKVVRRSVWCWLLGVRAIALWNRVYVIDSHVTPHMWARQLERITLQHRHGMRKMYKTILTYHT